MLENSKQESKYPRNDSVVVSYSNSSLNNIENNFTADIEWLFLQFLEMVAQNNRSEGVGKFSGSMRYGDRILPALKRYKVVELVARHAGIYFLLV